MTTNRSMGLRLAYPAIGLLLVLLGPVFFYFTLQFLRKVDYAAATLSFLAGWSLLRAGVDMTRAHLATIDQVANSKPRIEKPSR